MICSKGLSTLTFLACLAGAQSSLGEGRGAGPEINAAPGIEVRVSIDSARVAAVVRLPDSTESRIHAPWTWDAASRRYIVSAEREDTLVFTWRSRHSPLLADIWVWRASRTDPAGLADDLSAEIDGEGFVGQPEPDEGRPPWIMRTVGGQAGDNLPRFLRAEPSGSAADVSARGVWREGVWTVHLSRATETGEADDLPMDDLSELHLTVRFLPGRGIGKE